MSRFLVYLFASHSHLHPLLPSPLSLPLFPPIVYATLFPLASRTYTLLTRTGFLISTTLFITLIPLIMEIDREGVVMADEKLKVADLRSKGFQDSQMMQMGLSESAVYGTSVL